MGKKFDYDYIIIGSGAAGSAAAMVAAKAGLKVALIENGKWGGTGLNDREMPSGACFSVAHTVAKAKADARFGLSTTNLRYNYPTLLKWKETITRRSGAGSKKNFENAGITCIRGLAHFISPYEISVSQKTLSAANFLIATGTKLAKTGLTGLETVEHFTPEQAINVARIPKNILVAGAGASGCEVAQYFAELGAKVTLVELSDRMLPREDEEAGQLLEQQLAKYEVKFLAQSRVLAIESDAISKKVFVMRGGVEKMLRADMVVIATGMSPVLDLGLENAGVKFGKNGIAAEKTLQTTMKHIYAAGAVIGGIDSAEKAAYEGALATTNVLNKKKINADYTGFARTINTSPQIAAIGMTEEDLVKRDRKYKKVIVPLSACSVANITDYRTGFVKILAGQYGKILGATIVAPEATSLMQEIALAMKHSLSVYDLAETPHVATGWGELIRIAASKLTY